MNIRLTRLLLPLLAAGSASGAFVDGGINTCLDPAQTNEDYRCTPAPGVLSLDLSDCGITDDDSLTECFDAVAHLPMAEINLGDNSLTQLPEGIFDSIKSSLVKIYLQGNAFQQLPEDTFAGMSTLEWLHLESNDLKTLPAELFNGLAALWRLDLSDNPDLQCVPSTNGTSLLDAFILLANSVGANGENECACPATDELGACTVDCEPGTAGYICSDPSDTGDDTPAQDTTDPQQEIDEPDVQDTDGADFQDTDESDSEETADGSERQEVQEVTDGADTLADNESEDSPTPEVAAEEGLPTPMPTSDNVCNNGISGIQVGDACCKAGCAQCGGTDCSTITGVSGYGAPECCVDTILSRGDVCGGDVVAPCISYDTPSPSPAPDDSSCSTQRTTCMASNSCLQCMATTSIEEETSWQACIDGFDIDEAGSCADLTAKACCYAEVSSNSACLSNEDFVSYAKCFVGTDCLPLTCGDTTIASVTTTSGAGRLLWPLGAAPSGVASAVTVVMALAIVIVTIMRV